MTPHTGFPAVRLARVPSHGAVAVAAALVAAAAVATASALTPGHPADYPLSPESLQAAPPSLAAHIAPATGPPRTAQGEGDRSIESAMVSIATAFRNGDPDPLTTLLPSGGKVFLSLRNLGSEAGYYGPDQVYFIFQKIFRLHRSLSFDINQQTDGGRSGGRRLSNCIGRWEYERDRQKGRCQIIFVFAMKDDVWSLVQIREAL